jgi:hypothetical protein
MPNIGSTFGDIGHGDSGWSWWGKLEGGSRLANSFRVNMCKVRRFLHEFFVIDVEIFTKAKSILQSNIIRERRGILRMCCIRESEKWVGN